MPNSTREYLLLSQGVAQLDARLKQANLLDITMEHAGRNLADEVTRRWPAVQTPLLVLVGSGANGGDALVATRHLRARGYDPVVVSLSAKHPLTQQNRRRLLALGVQIAPLTRRSLLSSVKVRPIVLDGLLGTGFVPPLRPALAELITLLNEAALTVLSIDIPSGLAADSAAPCELCVQASVTAPLGSLKPAVVYGPANHAAGEVMPPLDLCLPRSYLASQAIAQRLEDAEVGAWLPRRFASAHKGTAGRVWILGGHPGTVGAPLLSARGALRAGAGLVTLYSPAEVPLLTPEVMIRPWPQQPKTLSDEFLTRDKPDAVAVGMGLGPSAAKTARLVLSWNVPVVIDADALQPELAHLAHANTILTPHPGEAARLLETDTAHITRNPLSAARELQQRFGGVVVLKGGPSTVATPEALFVVRGGHPGMATAGMGDTLAGVLAALLGQGLSATQAALVGTRLHTLAGERAAQIHGYGLIASDVTEQLGKAWQVLERS